MLWFPIIGTVPSLSHVTCWGASESFLAEKSPALRVAAAAKKSTTKRERGDRPRGSSELLVPNASPESEPHKPHVVLMLQTDSSHLQSRAKPSPTSSDKDGTKQNPTTHKRAVFFSLIVSSGTYQSGRSFVALLDQTDRQPDRQTATLQASPLRPWAPGRRSAKCGENRSSRGKRVSTGQLQQSQRSGADGRSRLAPPVAVLLYCYWWWAKREGRNQPLSPELTKPHLFFCSVFGNVHTWS